MKKDLIINTVQCGNIGATTPVWKEIAQLAEGCFVAIAQSGNMAMIATPMDAELSVLNTKLGRTLVAYGGERTRNLVAAKQLAAETAPPSVTADRLTFNSRYGVVVQGEGELLDGLKRGKVKLADVKKSELPSDLQKLDEEALKNEIQKRQKDRAELQERIEALGKEREEYLATERKRNKTGGDVFDEKVAASIRAQAARKGIEYGD